MKRSKSYLRSEDGAAALVTALILAAGAGAAVYYNSDRNEKLRQNLRGIFSQDGAQQTNLSALAQAQALMSFKQPNFNTPDNLPYFYPDPYLSNTSVGPIRTLPSLPTWSFANGTLSAKSSAPEKLTDAKFEAYVNSSASRPALDETTQLQFDSPIFDNVNAKKIVGYNVTAITQLRDANTQRVRTIKNKAEVKVPAMPDPTCSIEIVDPKPVYQTNEVIQAKLLVSGIATRAKVTKTATEVRNYPNINIESLSSDDISTKANRVRPTTTEVLRWDVALPRDWQVVAGTQTIPSTIAARIYTVDNTYVMCSKAITISSPSGCTLRPDLASVTPGSAVNLNFTTFGTAVNSSTTFAIMDSLGRDVSTLIQNKSARPLAMYVPFASQNSADTGISREVLTQYGNVLSPLSFSQIAVVASFMRQHTAMLRSVYSAQLDSLRSLTVTELHALQDLTGLQQSKWGDSLNLTRIDGLTNLNESKVRALKSCETYDDCLALPGLNEVYLSDATGMTNVDDSVISKIEALDPNTVATVVGIIRQGQQPALEYYITARVTDSNGGHQECVAQVTGGSAACPYANSLYKVDTGLDWSPYGTYRSRLGFKPADYHQVRSVSGSSLDTRSCSGSTRCFASASGTDHGVFVAVEKVDGSGCWANPLPRNDNGCFEYDTNIRMADGSDRPVHTLHSGDTVYNPLRKSAATIDKVIAGPEKLDLVVFVMGKNRVKVTTEHPMLTKSGLKKAINVAAKEEIQDQLGSWISIDKIEREQTKRDVYNIELRTPSPAAEDHAVLSNGFITGDYYLQQQLRKATTPGT